MVEYRTEEDTLGPVKIPADALWGPQTERSRHNFPTGQYMPLPVIRALLNIKKAAAQANLELAQIDEVRGNLIIEAIDSLLALDDEELRKDFPLKVYQTGSGTQTNMNTNEVVAHKAHELNPDVEILPNDHVNMGQSSNDTFPTAMNMAAVDAVAKLEKATQHLIDELKVKQDQYWRTVKVGRTHLQDATPLTFGHEFTAKSNKFYGLAHHSGLNVVHGAIKTLAADVFKIAQDIRFLASGPRAGYGELNIPANEPGSSIMPGKVNPTQAEAVTMAAMRVFGNDVVVSMSSSQGNFEMNVYKPVLIDAFLESADLLAGTMTGFADKMIHGLTVNEERMAELLDNSLMTVTALSPHIGYHDSAVIAQTADREGTTLREAALKSGKVTEAQYDEWMDYTKMTNIDREN